MAASTKVGKPKSKGKPASKKAKPATPSEPEDDDEASNCAEGTQHANTDSEVEAVRRKIIKSPAPAMIKAVSVASTFCLPLLTTRFTEEGCR